MYHNIQFVLRVLKSLLHTVILNSLYQHYSFSSILQPFLKIAILALKTSIPTQKGQWEVKANLQILILFKLAGRYGLVNDSSGFQQRSQRGLKDRQKAYITSHWDKWQRNVVLPAGSAHTAEENLGWWKKGRSWHLGESVCILSHYWKKDGDIVWLST